MRVASGARLVVAIPAYNEEVGIGSVVLRALERVPEVVVVDDGSTDATAKVAELAGARVIRHATNGGYGAALATIFRTAREEGWGALVILDSDGQHDPADIMTLAVPVLEGNVDVAIGSRFLERASLEKVPAYRRFGIGVLTRLTNVGAKGDARVSDGQSGFRAYSRRAIEAIDPKDADMGAGAEILLQARKSGLSFGEYPVRVRYDVDGSSQGPVRHALGVVGSLARFAELEHPLVFFALPGVALLALASAIGAVALLRAPAGLDVAALASSALLLVVGLLLAATGLFQHAALAAKRYG